MGINLKAWKINKPKYTHGWYRELTMDSYFAEFADGQSVLGRRMQTLVSNTVSRLLRLGAATATKRANTASAKAKKIHDDRQRAFQHQAAIVDRRQKACFDALVDPIRQRHIEQEAMHKEDLRARRAVREQAREQAQEQKKKAELERRALLACPVYQKQFKEEKVEKEKEAQRISVANYHAGQKRKREQQR